MYAQLSADSQSLLYATLYMLPYDVVFFSRSLLLIGSPHLETGARELAADPGLSPGERAKPVRVRHPGLTLKHGESLAELIDAGVLLLERINLPLLRSSRSRPAASANDRVADRPPSRG